MQPARSKILARPLALLSLVFALMMGSAAIYGMVQHYSPVPYADMLGVFIFYEALHNGDWSVWWAQHNEHRIVLARILFWLDWRLSDGNGVLLLGSHLLMIAAATWIFWQLSIMAACRRWSSQSAPPEDGPREAHSSGRTRAPSSRELLLP
jgi:hypothetical protein